jgi:hypothetical protein
MIEILGAFWDLEKTTLQRRDAPLASSVAVELWKPKEAAFWRAEGLAIFPATPQVLSFTSL